MTTVKNILKKLLEVKDAIIEGVEMDTASVTVHAFTKYGL